MLRAVRCVYCCHVLLPDVSDFLVLLVLLLARAMRHPSDAQRCTKR
jgi:hypothetical protein